jgi:hypothetical protein
MAISKEDLAALMEAAVKAAMAAVDGSREKSSGRLDERHFRRVEKYDGTEGKWKEWSFLFKTQVGAANKTARSLLDEAQKMKAEDPDMDTAFVEYGQDMVDKVGAELYSVLTGLLTGEPLTLVRGIPHGDGWRAWHKLYHRYNPRTPARALVAVMGAMSPKKVKDIRDAIKAIEEWEIAIKNIKAEYQFEVPEMIRIALLTSIVPSDLQDFILQHVDDNTKYELIRDRVMGVARNRISMATPTPMDIGQVGSRGEDHEWPGEGEGEGEDYEVDAVWGDSVCHRCGGRGHFARECATPKGGGKGDGKNGGFGGKGGKGDGKNGGFGGKGGKGDGKNGSFGGKGMKGKGGWQGQQFGKGQIAPQWQPPTGRINGQCYGCGEYGHRASACPKRSQAMEVSAVGEDTVEIGTVWTIAPVEVRQKIKIKNKYSELEADEEEEFEDMLEMILESGSEADESEDEAKTIKKKKWVKVEAKKKMGKERMICQIGTEKWVKIRQGEVTVDSAAEESVCPVGWCEEYELQPKAGRGLRFVTANGGEMRHYGSRKLKFQPRAGSTKDQTAEIEFQVCDVTKPLVAVRRLEEMGNKVHFGPKAEDNYIEKSTGEWILMRKKNGSYVIDVDFVVKESEVAQVFQRQAK